VPEPIISEWTYQGEMPEDPNHDPRIMDFHKYRAFDKR
jgi:hypothetical protein